MNNTVNKPEKKKRNGPRFNVVDAVIILLIIGSIVGVVLRFDLIEKLTLRNQTAEHEIVFSITNIQYASTSVDYMDAGVHAYNTETGKRIGRISAVDRDSIKLTAGTVLPDGTTEFAPESRVDVTGKISCRGAFGNGGFMLNGTDYIAPGMKLKVSFEKLDVTIDVIEILPVE